MAWTITLDSVTSIKDCYTYCCTVKDDSNTVVTTVCLDIPILNFNEYSDKEKLLKSMLAQILAGMKREYDKKAVELYLNNVYDEKDLGI